MDKIKVKFHGGYLTLKRTSDSPYSVKYTITNDLGLDDILELRIWQYNLTKGGTYFKDYKRSLEVMEPLLGSLEGCFPLIHEIEGDDGERYIDSIEICVDMYYEYPKFNLKMKK